MSYPDGHFVLLQHILPVPYVSDSVPFGQGTVPAEVATDDGPTVGTGDADAIDVEVSHTPAQR